MTGMRLPGKRSLAAYLRRGGLLAYPTESCFGLGCDPRNRAAVQCLLRLKRRPQHKGLILVASHIRQLTLYMASILPSQYQQLADSWPGPHTWLVAAAPDCPAWLTGQHSAIAVRVTAHPAAYDLCDRAGMALVSTSANRSGGKPAKTARACQALFGNRIKIMPGHVGKRRQPSTIQDLASGRILRGA